MFDPSFLELIIICVVALVVLGPDRLPGAIKTLGLWIGRLRRSFNNIKREIEQEVGADEIRRQLRNEAIMEKFNTTKNQITQSIDSVKKEAEAVKDDLDLKKGLSGLVDEDKKTEDAGEAEEIDPIEKLATSDPAANFIQPDPPEPAASQEPAPDSGGETSPDNTDAPAKSDKPDTTEK